MSEIADWMFGLSDDAISMLKAGITPTAALKSANPGLVQYHDSYLYRGQIGRNLDGSLVFLEPHYGIRAMSLRLFDMWELLQAHTIRKLIKAWTEERAVNIPDYVGWVSTSIKCDPDAGFNPDLQGRQLVRAIIAYENTVKFQGRSFHDWYDYHYLRDAVGSSHLR